MGGRDDELRLTLSLGLGVTTRPSFQPTHIHRPSNSMHNHIRNGSWKELFQFSGSLLISCLLIFSFAFYLLLYCVSSEFFVLDPLRFEGLYLIRRFCSDFAIFVVVS